jgi:hypothetical protein
VRSASDRQLDSQPIAGAAHLHNCDVLSSLMPAAFCPSRCTLVTPSFMRPARSLHDGYAISFETTLISKTFFSCVDDSSNAVRQITATFALATFSRGATFDHSRHFRTARHLSTAQVFQVLIA